MERRLAAIFALDMVGYSRLMESDEADTLARQEFLRAEFIDPTISRHHGRVVKGTGDGLLAEFPSAVDAVECAAEIQREMTERGADTPAERRIQFRIGINVGDIVARDGDIFGDGVNVAARIESLADPGGVLISGTAYNQVHNKVTLGFEDLGSRAVKNIERPVQVYRVLLDPTSGDTRPGQLKRPPMMGQLLRRRVPQFVGLYLLSGWAVLEFVDWAVRQYSLSPTISNFVVAILLLLLPSVAWLAWRHGAPGPDGWKRLDGTVILANLLVAVVVLGFGFGGEELGAATTTKVLEDEEGNRVERVVPKESLLRKVQIVGFDNESGDPDRDWLSYGLPIAVFKDLRQDAFVRAVGPAVDWGSTVEGLQMAGYEPPFESVPLSLLRELAERSGIERFLAGSIQIDGDTLSVETRLYETTNARLGARHSYRSVDPLDLADRISVDLRRDLGVPEWQVEEAVDLPVAELLTTSPEAFRLYVEYFIDLDRTVPKYEEALEDIENALEHDSTSAELLAQAGGMSLYFGDPEVGRSLLAEAMHRSYQLPERDRLDLRSFYQQDVELDLEGAIRTAHYWAELYPEDPEPWRLLSRLHRDLDDTDGVIEALRAVIGIDPSDPNALRDIAFVFRVAGSSDSALAYLRLVQDRWPTDAEAYTDAAKLLADLGRQDEARTELERALLVAPEDGTAKGYMVRLDIRNGRFDAAAEGLAMLGRESHAVAGDMWLLSAELTLAYETGQFGRLEDVHRRFLGALEQEGSDLVLVYNAAYSEFLQFAAEGRREEVALPQLDSLRSLLDPPFSHGVDLAAARIHADLNELDAARQSLARLEELHAALDEGFMPGYFREWHDGRITWREDGHCTRAIDAFDAAFEVARSSYQAQTMYDPLMVRLPIERAACLRALGRLDEAETAIDDLLARFPGSAVLRVEAAELYAALGRRDDAIAELETALETWAEADPEYVPAREARELLQVLRTEG